MHTYLYRGRAVVPGPVSRPFLGRIPRVGAVPPSCAARCVGRSSWVAAPAEAVGRASAASTGCAPRGHGPCACVATGRARTVRLGRARFRPSGTRLNFIIF
jgi:hypothetical protein